MVSILYCKQFLHKRKRPLSRALRPVDVLIEGKPCFQMFK